MSLATIPAAASVRTRGRAGGAEVVPLDRYRARAAGLAEAPAVAGVADEDPAQALARARAAHPAGRGRPVRLVESPEPAPPLRLTRRGRAVVRLLLAAVVLGIVLAGVLAGGTALGGAEPAPTRTAELVVLPGETLWSIAGEVAPGDDRRETVQRIAELNDLPGQAVHAGQTLVVPVP